MKNKRKNKATISDIMLKIMQVAPPPRKIKPKSKNHELH